MADSIKDMALQLRSSHSPLANMMGANSLPGEESLSRIWHRQYPGTRRWTVTTGFVKCAHFSLLALVRCEVQALDQHWFLHRLAVSLHDGGTDDDLATRLQFLELMDPENGEWEWPRPNPIRWRQWLANALEKELEGELDTIRHRQWISLGRELERVDRYFEAYQAELEARRERQRRDEAREKYADRLGNQIDAFT